MHQIFDVLGCQWVNWQKMALNNKKFYLLHVISEEQYIIQGDPKKTEPIKILLNPTKSQ